MDKQVNNKKKNKWLIFGVIILLLQVIASVVAIGEVYLLNMLPNALFTIVIGCFVFLLLLDGLMILLKGRKGKLLYVRRGVGIFISVSMIVAGSMVAFYVGTLNRTVSAISTDSKVSNVIAIYVQAEDEAKGIRFVDNYTFGITEEYDYDNTKKTLEAVETLLGKAVQTSSYKSVDDMVDALYRKEVGAIVLNKAYVSLLTEEEKYANFEEQMRVPYEYAGEIILEYRKKAPAVSINAPDAELDIPSELEHLVALVTASYVWLDDDPEKAQYYMSLYRDGMSGVKLYTRKNVDTKFNDVTRWA